MGGAENFLMAKILERVTKIASHLTEFKIQIANYVSNI